MLTVGEFLQLDGDKNIWEYFKLNWSHFFPTIGDRTAFVKQAGNLWHWINELHKFISGELGAVSDSVHITDGFLVLVCHFKRAHFSKIFKDSAVYGFCASKGSTYFRFKGHIIINSIGVILISPLLCCKYR